jgi:SNF2 family DNA or RNA helicase
LKQAPGGLRVSDEVRALIGQAEKQIWLRLRGKGSGAEFAPLDEISIECSISGSPQRSSNSIIQKYTNCRQGTQPGKNLPKPSHHSYLVACAETEITGNDSESPDANSESMTWTSGEMSLLDKLLEKLEEMGHEVLIFSERQKIFNLIQRLLMDSHSAFE